MALRLGKLTVDAVTAGRYALDGGQLFGVVPRALWEKALPPDDRGLVPLVARSLLVTAGRRRLLVDAGPGSAFSEIVRRRYAMDSSADVVAGLAALGVEPGDITDVVITHLHWCNAGGLVRDDGELTFPGAVHHVQRRAWKWAHSPSDHDRRSFRERDLAPLDQSGRLHFVEGETEVLDGVGLLPSEGHTVGQQLVRVTGDGRALLYCGDTIPTSAHLAPAWCMAFDLYPLTTIEEKKQILAEAIEEDLVLAFASDPVLGGCTVREEEGRVVIDSEVGF